MTRSSSAFSRNAGERVKEREIDAARRRHLSMPRAVSNVQWQMAGKKRRRRRSPDLSRRATFVFPFFFPLGIVFSPLTPPDCNFKFLRCNGTERLNFFCEFLGDGGGKGREREKKERIIPLAHAIVCSRNFNKNTVESLLAGVVWMGK